MSQFDYGNLTVLVQRRADGTVPLEVLDMWGNFLLAPTCPSPERRPTEEKV